jgi:tetratricopeptide (TPR) repeat protein
MVLIPGLLAGCATSSKPQTPFIAAQRYYEAGQDTEARRALESELAARPGNLDARYNLAVLLTRIGHDDAARKLYEENMRLGWNLPTVVNLSVLYNQAGEADRARKLLQDATAHFPNEAVPWYMLAEMDARDGHDAQARRDYEQALRADPKNGYAQIRYARFLAAHEDVAAALTHSAKAVALLPGVADCWRIHGDILDQAGNYDAALIAYQKSAALDPDEPHIRRRIIAVLRKLGDNARADHMEQALKRQAAMHGEDR